MTAAIVESISDRYVELYEKITGEKFVKSPSANIPERMENNIKNMLARLR